MGFPSGVLTGFVAVLSELHLLVLQTLLTLLAALSVLAQRNMHVWPHATAVRGYQFKHQHRKWNCGGRRLWTQWPGKEEMAQEQMGK